MLDMIQLGQLNVSFYDTIKTVNRINIKIYDKLYLGIRKLAKI